MQATRATSSLSASTSLSGRSLPARGTAAPRAARFTPRAVAVKHTVNLDVAGTMHVLEVDEDTNILEAAVDAGFVESVPHDCRMGVCLNCAARVLSGEVDQTAGMLSDEAAEKGYALLCVAYPKSDVSIATIDEFELMDEVRGANN